MGKIKCLKCNEILESKTRHDFVMCKCDNQAYVDGGTDYMRIGGADMNFISIFDKEGTEKVLSSPPQDEVKIPEPIDNSVDHALLIYSKLVDVTKEYLKELSKGEDKDDIIYVIYENIMSRIYGDDIWDFISNYTEYRR